MRGQHGQEGHGEEKRSRHPADPGEARPAEKAWEGPKEAGGQPGARGAEGSVSCPGRPRAGARGPPIRFSDLGSSVSSCGWRQKAWGEGSGNRGVQREGMGAGNCPCPITWYSHERLRTEGSLPPLPDPRPAARVGRQGLHWPRGGSWGRTGGTLLSSAEWESAPPQEGPRAAPHSPGWRLGAPAGPCLRGWPLAHAQTRPSPSAWSMTSEAPEVRGIISYLRLLAASPGSVPPKGLGAASCLALTEWLSGDTLTQPPGGPPTSAPLSVNGGSGYAKVGLEVRDPQPWSEGLGCSAGERGPVRMCGVLPDAPPPSVSCPPQWPSFSRPRRRSPGPSTASLREGNARARTPHPQVTAHCASVSPLETPLQGPRRGPV